jgi:serine/threonine-protein kinase
MAPSSPERDAFLDNLRRSRLLTARQLRKVVAKIGDGGTAQEIAAALVAARLLTRFQAHLLLRGKAEGFFFGPYRLLRILGQGGMGKVYKARDEETGRTVALKVLSPKVTNNPRARRLFLRETQAAARLAHANVVGALASGKVAGRHYLAMEFVDGPNLQQLVRKTGPLPVGVACEAVRQTALGLGHAHDRGMVHRDIKPANLIVGEDPDNPASFRVKVLDFGLARLNLPAEKSGDGAKTILHGKHTIMGTPDYVSPEQARDLHGVDIRADLYSLGCTFYYLLTARPPFPGGNVVDKLVRHGAEQPAFVETLRPDVPMAVADIVHRLLAKDPADRYQTPAELADVLAPFADARARIVKRKRPVSVAAPAPPPPPADTAAQVGGTTQVTGEHTREYTRAGNRALAWAGDLVTDIVDAAVAIIRGR